MSNCVDGTTAGPAPSLAQEEDAGCWTPPMLSRDACQYRRQIHHTLTLFLYQGQGVALGETLTEAFGEGAGVFFTYVVEGRERKWPMRPLLVLVPSEKVPWWAARFSEAAPALDVVDLSSTLFARLSGVRGGGMPDVFLAPALCSWWGAWENLRGISWGGMVVDLDQDEWGKRSCNTSGCFLESLGKLTVRCKLVAGVKRTSDRSSLRNLLGLLSGDSQRDLEEGDCIKRLKAYFARQMGPKEAEASASGQAKEKALPISHGKEWTPAEKRRRLEAPPAQQRVTAVPSLERFQRVMGWNQTATLSAVDKLVYGRADEEPRPDWARSHSSSQAYAEQVSWQRWALKCFEDGHNILLEHSLVSECEGDGPGFDVAFYVRCILDGRLNKGPLLALAPPNKEKLWRKLLSDEWGPTWPKKTVLSPSQYLQKAFDHCGEEARRRCLLLAPLSRLEDDEACEWMREVSWDGLILALPPVNRCRTVKESWLPRDLLRFLDGLATRQRTVLGPRDLLQSLGRVPSWPYSPPGGLDTLETEELLSLLQVDSQASFSPPPRADRPDVRHFGKLSVAVDILRAFCFDGERRCGNAREYMDRVERETEEQRRARREEKERRSGQDQQKEKEWDTICAISVSIGLLPKKKGIKVTTVTTKNGTGEGRELGRGAGKATENRAEGGGRKTPVEEREEEADVEQGADKDGRGDAAKEVRHRPHGQKENQGNGEKASPMDKDQSGSESVALQQKQHQHPLQVQQKHELQPKKQAQVQQQLQAQKQQLHVDQEQKQQRLQAEQLQQVQKRQPQEEHQSGCQRKAGCDGEKRTPAPEQTQSQRSEGSADFAQAREREGDSKPFVKLEHQHHQQQEFLVTKMLELQGEESVTAAKLKSLRESLKKTSEEEKELEGELLKRVSRLQVLQTLRQSMEEEVDKLEADMEETRSRREGLLRDHQLRSDAGDW